MSFSLFPKLPPEIRCMIWRECLPRRVVEIDIQPDDLTWDLDNTPPCRNICRIPNINEAPPLIARVCRESRDIAFEHGGPQLPDPGNEDTARFGYFMAERPWLDTARDTVHLNWCVGADFEHKTFTWGDPLRCLMWYAARTASQEASIILAVLADTRIERNCRHRWTRAELADLMRMKSSWTVVALDPIVVHSRPEKAGGLFGLLADAPVQLVDLDDKDRIHQYLALGLTSNVPSGPFYGADDLELAKQKIEDAVVKVFGSQDNAPKIRPVLMFRLCTRCDSMQ
ncbi:hypothetical protein BDV18DRAFT_26726 [Aspergillus unguis]